MFVCVDVQVTVFVSLFKKKTQQKCASKDQEDADR